MPSLPGLPAAETRSGSRWKPLLLGCAALLGLGLLVGAGLAVYGMFWVMTPGAQAPTSVVVGPSSAGVVRLNRAAGDAGVQALFRRFMLELQHATRHAGGRKLPAWLEALQSWQAKQQSQNMALWLPSEGTLSLERGPADEPARPVVALNFRRFIRPMAFMFEQLAKRDPKVRVQRHAGHEVISFPHGGGLCFADSTLLFAERVEALFPVLDRLGQPPSAAPLLGDLQRLSDRWDLAGSLPNRDAAATLLAALLHAARPAPAADQGDDEQEPLADDGRDALLAAESLRFGLDVRSADELQGMLDATYTDADAAQAAQAALAAALLELQRKAVAADLRLTVTPRSEGRELRLEAQLSGVEAAISRWLADTTARAEDANAGAR